MPTAKDEGATVLLILRAVQREDETPRRRTERKEAVSDTKSINYTGGVSFLGLLAIVFITLKLAGITEVAEWSWWWVLAPLWVPWAIFLTIIGGIFLVVGVLALIVAWQESR